ncbi:MAG: fumarylacetoacetate hydrolase family protein [Bdellovibrionales bacterium]|nr:fumarylacetoacetate hydrolase family protein [Bdellovibrionales bacterium]
MNIHKTRNIWCVGRNYSEHAKELGNTIPEKPIIFLKAGSCLQASNDQLVFPFWLKNIHHEIEVVLQVGEDFNFLNAYLGIDFTERTLQEELKKNSHPWTLAKSFPGAAAISSALPAKKMSDLVSLNFQLSVNGQLRQNGNTDDMIFSFDKILSHVKEHFPICPYDLIFTGTPHGVNQVKSKDLLEISCSLGVKHIWTIHQPEMKR